MKEGVELLPPRQTAVTPTVRASGEPYSATDFRELLGDPQNNMVELEEFIGQGNVPALLDILGLGAPLEEMSTMGGGAVSGYSGPLGSTSDKPAKRDTKKKKQKQYIDLGLLAEVMKLIKERGIINEPK